MDLNKLTQKELSELFDVQPKTIENWYKQTDDPLPFHHDVSARKYYIWSEILAWYVRRHITKTNVFKPEDELQASKLAGQNLRNEADALDLQVKKGELLFVEDVKNVWSKNLVVIRQNLLNVGHTCATEIGDGLSYAKKKKIIDDCVFNNLEHVIKKTQDEANEIG